MLGVQYFFLPLCCRYFICNVSATVSATVQLFTNQRIICVWLQVADVFIFFNFIEEDYTSQNDAQNRIDFTHFCTVMDQYTNWLWHILHSLIDIFINYTYKLTNGIL